MVTGNYKVQLYDPNTKGYGDYPNIGMHVEVKDPEDKIATKDKLNELQLRIRQLLDQVDQITKEQNYQRYSFSCSFLNIAADGSSSSHQRSHFSVVTRLFWFWSCLWFIPHLGVGFMSFQISATVEELAKRNARVIMACRNREKCVQVRRDIVLNTRNKQVYCRQCDLEDFDNIRAFVQKLSKGKFELDRIDGLVHNAAMMDAERKVNKDGIERTFATNHLGSFLMTALLMDKLLAQDHPVRIVFLNTNIIGRKCDLDFDDLNAASRKKYDGFEVRSSCNFYGLILDTNVSVTVADPGRTKSNLSSQMDGQTFFLSRWLLKIVSFGMGERRVEKAVRPVLFALADPAMEGVNGVFIDRERHEQPWCEAVEDVEKRRRLWNTSEVWTKLSERMQQMRTELGDAAALLDKSVDVKEASSTGRSWKRLWLW
ncbi:hypothetical protein TELCIR_14791 [Teladorsagia circumcincta]|uniref:Oxidoreductase, short chain dehydrogenase/reductase family protein n=1 Tax=Teladorsagia circumcincta TaxID=45464 RepID=A0A2G9TZZ3_TELCI|nr:hypothetical protein TELCIR_14791 [Teladorsagia circumcincta]